MNKDGIREQIEFNTRLLQLCAATLVLLVSGLVAQIKTGVFDTLFWVGVVVATVLLIMVLWLLHNIHQHIKSLRHPK